MTGPMSDERFAELRSLVAGGVMGTQDLAELMAEVERLRAKLDAPCGSCHPCTNYADETWRAAGRTPPHVAEWDELRAERNKAVATIAEQAQRLIAREREHNADRAELEQAKAAIARVRERLNALIADGFGATTPTLRDLRDLLDDPDEQAERAALLGSCLDEAAGMADA
ncbi:hypothetical protein [Microbispora sp. NPDC049633]|uniref:hypothetical protein n=1 Tax=Microbispora sp. NPDC049633 TaxID=3154355 RepID=UPI00341C421C